MGQVFPLGGEATIGRDPGTEVPLAEDTTVSRRHARIRASDGGYCLEDLGSSNGTFVNGGRVTEAPLRPGDEVSIGGTRFRFES
jgi:pSer/pThr/pTyr-binding forkhead associated (FHA) protein